MHVLLIGGARSGKTSLALRMAADAGAGAGGVTYVATAPRLAGDDDFDRRIDRHRAERPARWRTIEEPVDLVGALEAAGDDTVIVDCLTLWTSNLMQHGLDEDDVAARAAAAAATATARAARTIVVSNEVGWGVHPATELGRRFRDLHGRVNQRWSEHVDRAVLVVAGRTVELEPARSAP